MAERVSVTLDAGLYKRLKEIADEIDVSVETLLDEAVRSEVETAEELKNRGVPLRALYAHLTPG